MLHKVKLYVEELFMVKKSLNFKENTRRQILLINSKFLFIVPKGLNTHKLNHTITKLNQRSSSQSKFCWPADHLCRILLCWAICP